ncbi:MAG: hypothetical protein GX868_13790, partial [Actinobacteria bacterium]|nr:hypothetical protein [Actinomycetota bacterium]
MLSPARAKDAADVDEVGELVDVAELVESIDSGGDSGVDSTTPVRSGFVSRSAPVLPSFVPPRATPPGFSAPGVTPPNFVSRRMVRPDSEAAASPGVAEPADSTTARDAEPTVSPETQPTVAPTPVDAERPVPAVRAATSAVVPVTTDGVPLSLDVFAVTSRAVLVLIGAPQPAEQIAKTAIGLSIESEQSAAFDVVLPRAIDLVLYRAKGLVTAGIAADVVESYEQRLELWRRLSLRSGLEPAAIVLSLAPFPTRTIASMLRVALEDVEGAIERWAAGIDPDPTGGDEVAMRPAEIATGARPATPENAAAAVPLPTEAPLGTPAPLPTAATVGASAYAAASAVASAGAAGGNPADHRNGGPGTNDDVVAMNEDALNAFLGLPDGPGSRLRQA